jgi:hypothetical protein
MNRRGLALLGGNKRANAIPCPMKLGNATFGKSMFAAYCSGQ